jgi:hypothetical protein
MVCIDKNLAWKRESQDGAFTILMWNLSKDELISELKHKLALISNIKNTFKRAKLNDRLYEYLVQIEKSSTQSYDQIVLIGSETIIYKLDKNDVNILKEYSIQQFTISNDESFNIEWLVDLFENFKFYDVVINNSNNLTHWSGNLNKKKIIKQNVNQEYIKNLNSPWFMVGKMQPQHKNKFLIEHYPNLNSSQWKDIINEIELLEIKKKVNELQEHLDNLAKNSDKYIFGNDIYELIEQYNVKEIYLHKNIKKNFDDKIVEKNLTSNINFNIIQIDTIDKNISDASVILDKNYSGILGIKYY